MTIASLIPCDLKNLLREIEDLGFSLCLVGGASRDFKMQKTLSPDLDFEIRNQDASVLRTFLKNKKINYTELPYQITRVDFHGFDLEFSTPRIERQIDGNTSHHHFEAELSPTLSYKEAFKRRDFTLNAIGIELDITHDQEKVIDPYGGIRDLEQKVLREISDDFFLDSVRFLRLIRFTIKYNLQISESITTRLSEFDLSGLSKHHFLQEMKKSLDAGVFINKFNELVRAYKLSLPLEFKFLNELKFSSGLKTKDDLLIDTFLQNENNAHKLSSFFSMPEKRLRDLKSFSDSFRLVKVASKEEMMALAKVPISDLKGPGLLKELKNLEEKKEWRPYFNEVLPVSWNDWESVTVSASELEAVPVSMRSYLRFYKALKQSLKI